MSSIRWEMDNRPSSDLSGPTFRYARCLSISDIPIKIELFLDNPSSGSSSSGGGVLRWVGELVQRLLTSPQPTVPVVRATPVGCDRESTHNDDDDDDDDDDAVPTFAVVEGEPLPAYASPAIESSSQGTRLVNEKTI